MSELDVGSLIAHLAVEDREWDPELREADREMHKLAQQARSHMGSISDQFRKAGQTVEDTSGVISGAADRMAVRVAAAQSKLAKARDAEAESLRAVIRASDELDFERIGGDTDKMTAAARRLDAALQSAANAMRNTSAAGRDLSKIEKEFAEAGREAGEAMSKEAGSALTRMGPYLAPLAVPAGAAAGGAVALGFAAGIAGIGIATMKETAHVQQEFANLGAHVKARSLVIFEPFGQSLIDIRRIAQDTFDQLAPGLDRAADRLGPATTRLVRNVSEALLNLEPAFDPLTRAGEKVMDMLGGRLPNVTARLERGMTDLAEAVEANPEALADLAEGASVAAESILKLLAALTRAYGPLRDVVTWAADLNDKIAELTGFDDDRLKWDQPLQDNATAAHSSADAFDRNRQSAADLQAAQDRAAESAERMRESMEALQDATYGGIDANLALRDAIDQADDSTRDYNDAVKAHGVNSEQATDALLSLEQQALRVAEAARDNAYAQQEAAGKTRDSGYANQAARDALAQFASTLRGPAAAAVWAQVAALDALNARLRSVQGTYYAKVQISVVTTGRYTGPPMSAMPAFARGGSIGPNEIGRVAEHEPEVLSTGGRSYLLMHNQPGYITPVSQLSQQAGGVGVGAGGGATTVLIDGRGLRGIERALIDGLRKYVQVSHQGNVQRAFGQNVIG